MLDDVTRREVEPFSFFSQHASAIPGLGGDERSPNPDYCFHTPYHEYRPGVVIFTVNLAEARASYGELALRVHAFRPDSGENATLVAGNRMPLDGVNVPTLEISVRFSAVPGVLYALFGYFSEPANLRAAGLTIIAEERGNDNPADFVSAETTRSLFEGNAIDDASRVIADGPPHFFLPLSQPMTAGQLASAEYRDSWPEVGTGADPAIRWRQAYALQAVQAYGMLQQGTSGLLVASEDMPIGRVLRSYGGSLTEWRILPGESTIDEVMGMDLSLPSGSPVNIERLTGQFDFLIALTKANWFRSKDQFLTFVTSMLRHVLRGGLAVFLFDHVNTQDSRQGRPGGSPDFPAYRTDIQQLAIRIIAHGSSVAQLKFADPTDSDEAKGVSRPFGFIVRR